MTALQEQIEAILAEIQGAMTRKQISYLAGLQLTQEDVQTFMEENELMAGPAGGEGGASDGASLQGNGEGAPLVDNLPQRVKVAARVVEVPAAANLRQTVKAVNLALVCAAAAWAGI